MSRKSKSNDAKRVIGYIRVSTDKQVKEGLSLDAQAAKLRQYCDLYQLELVEIVMDDGYSASSLDRPELPGLLNRLDRGEADAVLVTNLDRLTRNVRDLGDLLERCERNGWAIHSVNEQLDTQSAAGRLIVNILGAVSQWQREYVGERVEAVFYAKRQKGEYCGGKVPTGKRLEGGMLYEDENQTAARQRALELRKQGISIRKICAALTREGYVHPCGNWSASTVHRITAEASA